MPGRQVSGMDRPPLKREEQIALMKTASSRHRKITERWLRDEELLKLLKEPHPDLSQEE